jgi:hypothetical protein
MDFSSGSTIAAFRYRFILSLFMLLLSYCKRKLFLSYRPVLLLYPCDLVSVAGYRLACLWHRAALWKMNL